MRSRCVALVVVALAFLSACGSTENTSEPAGSDGGDKNASSTRKGDDDEAKIKILDSGFGQNEFSVEAPVIVTTDSEAALGESVTVSVNFLDAKGQILGTETQVESFNWLGQQLVLPVSGASLSDPAKVANIEPSVSLSDYGMNGEAKAPLPVLNSTEIKKGEFGDWTASFAFTNDTEEDLKDLRVGVVCYNAANKIIGGTSTYPELAPAGKTIRIEADPTVSAKPASCKAFVNYDVS